jgi:hypothetical protein
MGELLEDGVLVLESVAHECSLLAHVSRDQGDQGRGFGTPSGLSADGQPPGWDLRLLTWLRCALFLSSSHDSSFYIGSHRCK